jgi:hypothetical protein
VAVKVLEIFVSDEFVGLEGAKDFHGDDEIVKHGEAQAADGSFNVGDITG